MDHSAFADDAAAPQRERHVYDGTRMRTSAVKRDYIDYSASVVRRLEERAFKRDFRDEECLQPESKFMRKTIPPMSTVDDPPSAYACRFAHTSLNKKRYPVNCLAWTPDGRRLVTGANSGEFTLWGGTAFNFVTILQAHDQAVRCLTWSNDDDWLVSADQIGKIGYWKSTMANFKMFTAHDHPVRCLSFAPTDLKFASGADDSLLKIWDFATQRMERELKGHNWDVRACDWHPTKALLASGGKDAVVKLWDPRDAACVFTMYGHKQAMLEVSWNKNGNWLLTSSRDQSLRILDIRMLRELNNWKVPRREVTSFAWHPFVEDYFATGAYDGSMAMWRAGHDDGCVAEIPLAHDGTIWDMEWHPLGHVLATCSYDNMTRFWTRHEPGDTVLCTYTRQRSPWDASEPSMLPDALGMSRETASAPPKVELSRGARGGATDGIDAMRRLESTGPPSNDRPLDKTSTLGKTGGFGVFGTGSMAAMPRDSGYGGGAGGPGPGGRPRGRSTVPPQGYVCRICNEPGHWIQECPTSGDSSNRGGPSARRPRSSVPPSGYVCRICNTPGHWIQECPSAGSSGGGRGDSSRSTGSYTSRPQYTQGPPPPPPPPPSHGGSLLGAPPARR